MFFLRSSSCSLNFDLPPLSAEVLWEGVSAENLIQTFLNPLPADRDLHARYVGAACL